MKEGKKDGRMDANERTNERPFPRTKRANKMINGFDLLIKQVNLYLLLLLLLNNLFLSGKSAEKRHF